MRLSFIHSQRPHKAANNATHVKGALVSAGVPGIYGPLNPAESTAPLVGATAGLCGSRNGSRPPGKRDIAVLSFLPAIHGAPPILFEPACA